jgi:bacteriocin-like protein
MERQINQTELTNEDLENVTGGGLLHFFAQIFTPADHSNDGGSAGVHTHDADYKVYVS